MRSALSLAFLLFISAATGIASQHPARILAGIAYAPSHGDILSPDVPVSEERLRHDLEILSGLTDRVRTYSIDNGMDRVPAIAASLGLKVSLGIWLSGDRQSNERQISAVSELLRTDTGSIDRVFVGNETLLRGDLNVDELRAYLRRVKQAAGNNIEVTTGETWGFWLKYPALAQDCDVVAAHILPYWDGYPIDVAIRDVTEQLATLSRTFPGKRIVIGETGWPSRGAPYKGSIPSLASQEMFIKALLTDPIIRRADYYVVEGFEQPWKVKFEGQVGSGWGLFDSVGRPKLDIEKLRRIAKSASGRAPRETLR